MPQSTSLAYCPVNLPADRGKLHPKRLHLSPKVLHNPDEYHAYMAALGKSDPRQKAAAMEEFVALYPHSKMRIDALEQAMAAYQASGNTAKVADVTARVLQAEPGNVRALAILVFLARDCATRDLSAEKELSQVAQKGLAALPEWQETQGASLPDGEKLRNEMAAIFAGAAGFGALKARDYPAARRFYEKAWRATLKTCRTSTSSPSPIWRWLRSILTGFGIAARLYPLLNSRINRLVRGCLRTAKPG